MIDNNSFDSIKASTTVLQKLDVQFNQKHFNNFART